MSSRCNIQCLRLSFSGMALQIPLIQCRSEFFEESLLSEESVEVGGITPPNTPTNCNRSNTEAYLCMLVIGVGYMFPICAVWAAFDYWKFLLSESVENASQIEFELNAVYQTGSVSTVLFLALFNGQGASVPLRVYFGFLGQFLTLFFLLSARFWASEISIENLRFSLLLSTLMLSVVTGVLDSAILSLNSQYDSKMQEAMQIGIGCSISISIFLRVITKALGRTDESAATAFFSSSLGIVVLCILAFRTLLKLKVSENVVAKLGWDNSFSLIFERHETSSEDLAFYSPLESRRNPSFLIEENSRSLQENWKSFRAGSNVEFLTVLRKCWKFELVVFSQFVICAFGYPALITAVPCFQGRKTWLGQSNWFQTIQLALFAISDLLSRFCIRWRGKLENTNFGYTLIPRVLIAGLLFIAATGRLNSDFFVSAIVSVFGLLNGYFVSLAVVLVNDLPNCSKSELFLIGRFSAFALNFGLCIGGILAAVAGRALNT